MGKDRTPKGEDVQVGQEARVSEALSVQSTLPEVGLTTPSTAAINTWQPEADRVRQPPREATEQASSVHTPSRVSVIHHHQLANHTALGHLQAALQGEDWRP